MNNRKYWIETYGCQMNKAESEALGFQLQRHGWKPSDKDNDADIVILNTCSVRKTAETRIWGRIGHFKHLKDNRPFKLLLTGCMAERLKENFFKSSSCIDMVIGNFQKHTIPDICDSIRTNGQKHLYAEKETYFFPDIHHQSGVKAFIPVMHGCNNYCTYCIVPYVRGPEVSRSPANILGEISHLDEQGVKEITLLGQNVNSYRYVWKGREMDFPALMTSTIPVVRNIEWIRFLTSHPKDVSETLIHLIGDNPLFCRHIHLPVQHGSDKILKIMNRGYTSDDYRQLVEKIKKYISGVSVTTDILIGFPDETEQDFMSTLTLMKEIEFDDAFMYRYNKREGTAAYNMGNTVPEKIKLERLKTIIELQRNLSKKKKKQKIGQKAKVLVEGISKKNKGELLGRTEQDEMVVFAGNEKHIGSFITVRLLSLKGNTFWGKEIM